MIGQISPFSTFSFTRLASGGMGCQPPVYLVYICFTAICLLSSEMPYPSHLILTPHIHQERGISKVSQS